jgi:hypothetical protein
VHSSDFWDLKERRRITGGMKFIDNVNNKISSQQKQDCDIGVHQ